MKEKVLYEELTDKISNKYELTVVTGQRVRELGINGENGHPLKKNIIVQKVLQEVKTGKLYFTRLGE